MKFTRLNSLSYKTLCSLADLARELGEILINPPTSISRAIYHIDKRYMQSPQKFKRGIVQLKGRGLIQEYKKGGKNYFKFTKRGKLEIARITIKEKQKGKWDKKWRLVIFDIPEISRRDRDFLRSQLQWLGFLELQKSVWIFPHDVQKELKEFIKLCRIELQGDVRFLVVESIDFDKDLKQEFGLGDYKKTKKPLSSRS